MKLDILVLAAHPDDAELGCGATIAKHISMGNKVGIVDFTKGELGTRGTIETRAAEAAESSKILGISSRINLGLRDGFFVDSEEDQLKVIQAIRTFQPNIILANAIRDRHSDHGRASSLATHACFLSGLAKIETKDADGNVQPPWRARAMYHYIQSDLIMPDFVVDISKFWDIKMKAIKAFKTQFHDPESKEPETYISSSAFIKKIEARAIEFGNAIGAEYGEGFTVERFLGVNNLNDLL